MKSPGVDHFSIFLLPDIKLKPMRKEVGLTNTKHHHHRYPIRTHFITLLEQTRKTEAHPHCKVLMCRTLSAPPHHHPHPPTAPPPSNGRIDLWWLYTFPRVLQSCELVYRGGGGGQYRRIAACPLFHGDRAIKAESGGSGAFLLRARIDSL